MGASVNQAGDILRALFDKLDSGGKQYVALISGWQQIVGERLAAHTRIADIAGATLVVEADHPAWIQTLMFEQRRILDRVRTRYPQFQISALRVRLAGSQERSNADESEPTAGSRQEQSPPIEADERKMIERIEDDELRSSLERLRKMLPPDEKLED